MTIKKVGIGNHQPVGKTEVIDNYRRDERLNFCTSEGISSYIWHRHCRACSCILARPYGFKTTLVEVAPRLRTGGYVIDFWGRGFDVAEKMGILPAIKREVYDIRELRFVDTNGRGVGGFNAGVFRSATLGRYVSILRGELAKIIYQKIEGHCETIFGDSIVRLDQDEKRVHVAFEHARLRDFDFVIGADGLHSVVRRLVFGKGRPFREISWVHGRSV